jgi:ParB-like chromosome segregation protein Spo0J
MTFKNAILRYGEQRADQFQAHPLNPRIHPEKQRKLVKASLDRFGWVAPVVVNVVTGHVIDGHERVWQALALGDGTMMPFVEVNVPEHLENELIAVFDRITYEATYDPDNLQALLDQIHTDDEDLGALLREMEEAIVLPTGDSVPTFDDLDTKTTCPKCGHCWNT